MIIPDNTNIGTASNGKLSIPPSIERMTNVPLAVNLSLIHISLRNRTVMTPIGTNFAEHTGEVNERIIDYYKQRAKGGTCLLYTSSPKKIRETKKIVKKIVDESASSPEAKSIIVGCLLYTSRCV